MFYSLRKASLTFIIILVLLMISSCSKKDDSPVTPAPTPESSIKTIGSNESGTISTPSGIEIDVIQGAVPPNLDNSNAKVTFSIESPVDPPSPLPAGAIKVGNMVRFGPDAFVFRWPVRLVLPYGSANPDNLKILHFNPYLSKWFIVSASSIDANKKVIGTDVLELGYYVLATVSFSKRTGTDSEGGFQYTGESGFYYSLTVKSVTFKYSAQAAWYNLVGKVAGATGSQPTGGPLSTTYARLPQGTYEIWISKTKPGTLFELPKQYTYTIPFTGTINGPLSYWGLGNETGWSTLTTPSGGDWKEGGPGEWPQPTKPMGTGEFQATLTWINTSSHAADMDLHLYGPNSIHVYWDDKISSDGSLQLDRDWMSEAGNAVENIFSVSQIPKGNYTVKVNNFGGDQMSFNLRVIRFGSVKTYSGTQAHADGEVTYTTFTVN